MHGKNLFYFFGSKDDPVVMHFHFGMSGAFRTMSLPGPDPTETTRLQVSNPAPSQHNPCMLHRPQRSHAAQLFAPCCGQLHSPPTQHSGHTAHTAHSAQSE